MSALDQAFIKAYGQQVAAPAAVPDRVPEMAPVAPSAPRPPEQSAVPKGHPVIPPPHIELSAAEEAEEAEEADEPAELLFRPMLQVEQFRWPKVCRRLDEAGGAELDRLTDGLVEAMAQGSKVLAIAGCRKGEGATTLLLCAARRLADRGFKVAMVDGNLARPRLARRLDLLPEVGWENVLSGELPLEEVVIESVADRLALLPVRKAVADSGKPIENEACLADGVETLADHYDLVLVDLVPLEDLDRYAGSLARGIGGQLDAIALVHHARITPHDRLTELQQSLAATDVVQVGIVENFFRN